jgi:hypothetical protein
MAARLDELANLDRIGEVYIKLNGRLRFLVVGVPGRQAHGTVCERH